VIIQIRNINITNSDEAENIKDYNNALETLQCIVFNYTQKFKLNNDIQNNIQK